MIHNKGTSTELSIKNHGNELFSSSPGFAKIMCCLHRTSKVLPSLQNIHTERRIILSDQLTDRLKQSDNQLVTV